SNPALQDITLDRLKSEHSIPLKVETVPFTDGIFPTPSGKVELFSQTMADMGLDPVPGFVEAVDEQPTGKEFPAELALNLISGAAHHFVTSSFANQPNLLKREGEPFVEIHPDDANLRGIEDGEIVIVENGRGWCELKAVVTDAVRPGVAASPKGRWSKLDGGRNINWTTSDALGDMAGQSTFHTNSVWIKKIKK
ncbi:MAG: molybdopterin oxidoreductase family protein, partial [Anaerolineae bacterium]|nr:molybdopterin oxidoreductase family protein [Anaerolineae bacterium]